MANISFHHKGEFSMHITITGKLGSGKSTVAKKLVEQYGFEIFSTGAILRAAAAERGMDVLELNKELSAKLDSDRSMDDLIDNTTIRVAAERKDDKLIFDSRMAWHFVPDSFKVFVTVAPCVAAERVMKDPRPGEPAEDVDELCAELVERSKVEQARFQALYGVDYYDYNNYNLVVDSSNRTPDEIVSIIWEGFNAYMADPAGFGHKELL
jgi:cytidylate kinase